MSHDVHASWAATELARHFQNTPADCLHQIPVAGLSAFASREGRTEWPIADGVIVLQSPPAHSFKIAIEFKRANEGTHGVLTALGQAIAYINKGYNGAVLVLPREYPTHKEPGIYASSVLATAVGRENIGVFTYLEPDTTLASPFRNKLHCARRLEVDRIPPARPVAIEATPKTQWMHVREGSSTPSAFFLYLELAKSLSPRSREIRLRLPVALLQAIEHDSPGADPIKYLSNSIENNFRDKVWRHFWFRYIFRNETVPIWRSKHPRYVVNDTPTLVMQADGISPMRFFAAGRSNSPKNNLVNQLNNGSITEAGAWLEYVKNVRKRAHSFREDIDSGLEHMGMLDEDGRPTDLGYRFITISEQTRTPHEGMAKAILAAAMLRNGDLLSLIHYVHRLSEERFREDVMAFAADGTFNQQEYLQWVVGELAENLRVLRRSRRRGGVSRKPLQGEITLLRKFDFVSRFRIGVGLEINWTVVQEALDFPL